VQSVAAYPALSDCPEVPDLVVVCVPAPLVPDIVDEAGKLGVRAVCVISAGFSEVSGGGPDLQEDLMRRAQAHGLRIVGPNCMGLLNAAADHRLNATFSQLFPRPGRVGFLSQSGALGLSALKQLEEHRIGVSTFISVGNKSDVSGNDLLLYWEDDPDTDVILLYLESFGNPRRFARIARRIARRKPIVAVKGGRTGAGQRAVSSHTAAIAAGDVAVDALFRQSGVIRTDTLAEMLDVAAVLGSQPPPPGPRVAIVTNGGGPGALAADACEDRGLEVPQLSEETVALLRSFLAAEAAIGNPVDMIASSTAQQYGQTVRALADSSDVDAVLAIFIPPVVTRAEDVAAALASAQAEMPADKTLVAVFMDTGQAPDALAEAGIPFFTAPEPAATALGRAAEWGAWRRRPQGSIVRPAGTAPDRARALVDRALDGRDSVWASAETTREILESYGIPLARAVQVQTPEEAAEAQRDIGAPVAVKLAAPIHKADVGGLTLDVKSPEQAADAVTSMRQRLVDAGLGEHAEAFLVQEMVTDGVEMAAGVTSDPSFGPLVMAGLGGTLVELLGDVAVRVTPLTDLDVHEMLTSLKAYRLLRGYRGSPARDIAAFSELLLRLGALVEDVPEIAELDLNPVFVRTEGAVAVDARIRLHAS
jgi:acetate---CoA ligase (ADP-forming)